MDKEVFSGQSKDR